jgi:hypothetical protein
MASPFSQYANLSVNFKIPEGEDSISSLGNPQFEVNELITIGWVNRVATLNNQSIPDGELSRLSYSGFWVFPFPFAPDRLMPEQVGDAVLWRITKEFTLPAITGWENEAAYQNFLLTNEGHITARGDLILNPTPPGQYGVELKTGDPLEGTILLRTAWGDAI